MKSDSENKEPEEDDPMDSFYPQTLAGFIMVLTEEGDMIFLTENVNKYIGIVQVRSQNSGVEVMIDEQKCSTKSRIIVYIEFGCFVNDALINGFINCQFLLVSDSWSCWVRVFMTSSIPAIRRSWQTCWLHAQVMGPKTKRCVFIYSGF